MSKLVVAIAVAVAVAVSNAAAFSRQELQCQATIGKAGRSFVAAELANRARCKLAIARGHGCDPGPKTAVHAAKLRKVVMRCGGVSLSSLGLNGCASESANTADLAQCLIGQHESAVAALIAAQFGLVGREARIELEGQLTQATATLLPPANLVHYKLSQSPLDLNDLKVVCLTATTPPLSASANVDGEGRFALDLAAIGLPFGCVIVDQSTDEQVAVLVFRTAAGDQTQVQLDLGGSVPLGTVGLDLSAGEAVVDATLLNQPTSCSTGTSHPTDFTGTWQVQCTPGPARAGFACPTPTFGGFPEELYLHRVSGIDATGAAVHWLGVWENLVAFSACRNVEGLAVATGGISTAAGETLTGSDGPFEFSSDAAVFDKIDSATSPVPSDAPRSTAVCRSSAATCAAVRNYDGQSCAPPQGSTRSPCWGTADTSDPPVFTPYTDAECRALCAGLNLYTFPDEQRREFMMRDLRGGGYCVERKLVDFHRPSTDPFITTGDPIDRLLFGQLHYLCDDTAVVVDKEPTRTIGLVPQPGQLAPVGLCHVTRRTEITLKQLSPSKLIGSVRRGGSLQAGDPEACANLDDPTNPVARMLLPERMLVTLTR